MSETTTRAKDAPVIESDTERSTPGRSRSLPERRPSESIAQLESDRGTTSIDDSVVAKIAGMAAREVDGVAQLGGTLSTAIGGVVSRIRGSEHRTAGVGVEVGKRQAAVDLSVQIAYPAPVHEVSDAVRQNVIDRIESLTGLEVVEVNIAVIDLTFAGGQQPTRVD